ncbi:hypothetical protein IIE18_13500 [Pseudomonas sp. V1]|uniref:hypothetical protein n=1 Tax=Pseudomonas arcuscaelestis TaxID=2710591 RepID=UPI00193F0C70|nr:hypothetical protein [Pseudomonas arcuscaelestis]MBM3106151.1 hypothetical protein [Pseudomonas arcuscaelestis]
MAEKKTGAAKHAADYRANKKAEAQRLGIKRTQVDLPAAIRKKIDEVMKRHDYSQLQELWQDLALSLIAADPEEQARRLKRPDASAFEITPKLARQFDIASRAELKRDPGYEIQLPEALPHGEQQCKAAQLDILN